MEISGLSVSVGSEWTDQFHDTPVPALTERFMGTGSGWPFIAGSSVLFVNLRMIGDKLTENNRFRRWSSWEILGVILEG